MEEAAARISQDNCELACCFIQKTAVEKAGPEMDKRLATVRRDPPLSSPSVQFASCATSFSPCRSLSCGNTHDRKAAVTATPSC